MLKWTYSSFNTDSTWQRLDKRLLPRIITVVSDIRCFFYSVFLLESIIHHSAPALFVFNTEIVSHPPIFHKGLSCFKLLFIHSKYVFRNRWRRCYDDIHSDVIKRTRLRIGKVICEFVSYNIPAFWLLPLKGFVFMFLMPVFRSYFQKTRLGLSLHFKPNLQSAVRILYRQELWPLSTRLIPNFSVSPGFPFRRSTTASFQTDLSFVWILIW